MDALSANRLPQRMNELHQDEPQKNDPKKNELHRNDRLILADQRFHSHPQRKFWNL